MDITSWVPSPSSTAVTKPPHEVWGFCKQGSIIGVLLPHDRLLDSNSCPLLMRGGSQARFSCSSGRSLAAALLGLVILPPVEQRCRGPCSALHRQRGGPA